MSAAANYKKLTQREHILQLPDTYIGSRDSHREQRWVYSAATGRMEWREVSMNPGLFKIFDELIVNALDHVTRQSANTVKAKRVSQIRVTLTPTMFSVFNDGDGIPVTVHPEYKVMVPELIFGHLLTSSNYDEKEEKVVGGKNGYGAKLTNIYSRRFVVRTVDTEHKLNYEQVFRDNMATVGAPTMKKVTDSAKAFTEITSEPDLERFFGAGCTEIPADMMDILRTRVVDAAAMAAGHGVSVYFATDPAGSAALIPVKSFEQYVRLFVEESGAPVFYERCGPRWEVAAVLTRHLHAESLPDDRHISFVNGIFTRRGGKHVDAVARAVFGAFCEGPGKKLDLKPAQLKDAVTFFVNATIVNPSFDSQTKETLTTPVAKFGSTFKISDGFISRLAKEGGLLEEAQAILDARLSREAKKSDGRKAATVRGIPKLEDAGWAGTAKSPECTLILTEGDSAATMAIAGLKIVGREAYGVFPLKGKILNVRGATMKEKTDNEEITRIKRILGLEHGRKYTDLKQLRYGRVMIMTDQDVDGSHIKGLLINLFHTEWPELLKMGFLCSLVTPLLKATKGAQTLCFYSSSEYDKWLMEQGEQGVKGWKIKYYKGLGTSTATEARDYFTSMNTMRFQWDDGANDNIDLAFNEKRADDRKEWLGTYDPARSIVIPAGGTEVTYSEFINDDLIHFSNANVLRSIPHVMDGFKPSQRKILWAARKRNLTAEIKVAQLAGYVSEHAAYHHGEVSLMDTITGMAQNYVGSNNINLLSPNGQFGTRLQGGKDAAQPRYIFTALEPIVSTLIQKADDPALKFLEDDGATVEPEFYMPVLPLILVNGSVGIGTGYSTSILPHSPTDLVAAFRARLRGEIADLTAHRMVPWWEGFRGAVTLSADGKTVTTKGIYEFLSDDSHRVKITELPVGTWTIKYKEFLEKMMSGDAAPSKNSDTASSPRLLKDYQNASTDDEVCFILQLDPEYFHEARTFPAEFEKKFKLTASEKLTNMMAFDVNGHVRRFASAGEIMETFYMQRIGGYVSRKTNELRRLDAEIVELDAKARFVKAVVTGKLVVANAEDDVLLAGLKAIGIPALSDPESPDDLRAYEYVLRMRVDRLKAKAVLELEEDLAKVRAVREELDGKTPEDLWLADLDVFSEAYERFMEQRSAARAAANVESKGTVKKVVKRAAAKKTAAKA